MTTYYNSTLRYLYGSLPSQNNNNSGHMLWLNKGRITIWQQPGKRKMRRLSALYSLMDSYWAAWISEGHISEGNFRIFWHKSGVSQEMYSPKYLFSRPNTSYNAFQTEQEINSRQKRAIFEALVVTGTQVGSVFLSDLWGSKIFPTESFTVQVVEKNGCTTSDLEVSLVLRIQMLQISFWVHRIRCASHLCHVLIGFLDYCWSLENYFSAYDSWDTSSTISLYRYYSVTGYYRFWTG